MSRTDKTKENTNRLSRLGRRKLVSFLVLLLILFALPVATFLVKQRLEPRLYEVRTGKVYYASPGDNLQNKIDRMQPGDTLLLKNGAYYSPLYISNKQGTVAAPLTIKAVNDGKAIIDGSQITTEWTPPVFIGDGSAYIDLEGVVARNAPQSSTDASVNEDVIKIFGTGTHDITLRRVTAHDAAPGNYHCFDVGFGANHVLIEDSAGWGRCRYVFLTYHGDHNTFRRDFAYAPYQAQADFYPAPRSGFGNYGSTNSLFENDIGTKTIPPTYDDDYYSGLWQDSDGSAYPDDNAQFLGDIFYKNCDGFVMAGSSFGKNEVMKDTFLSAPDNPACDTYTNRYAGGSAKGMEWDSPDGGLIAYTTFVQSPGGFRGSGASAVVNITHSVFLSQGTAIVSGDPRLSHDDFYGNGSNGIRLNSTDKTANPGYNTVIYGMGAYLMPAPTLLGQGQNGTDIGSHIIYEYVNGQLTNTPLWPWPMENRIMAEKGISVTWAANGGIWNTLNGVYPKATGTSSPKNEWRAYHSRLLRPFLSLSAQEA